MGFPHSIYIYYIQLGRHDDIDKNSSQNITDLICVIEHLGGEIAALLVVAGVLVILGHVSVLACHHRRWCIAGSH